MEFCADTYGIPKPQEIEIFFVYLNQSSTPRPKEALKKLDELLSNIYVWDDVKFCCMPM